MASCIQMRSSDTVSENVAAAVNLIEKAAQAGAQLVVTPEMTSLLDRRPGALLEKAKVQDEDPALPVFREIAAKLAIDLIIGSLPIKIDDTRCANRSFFISRLGDIVASYDKIHMFDVALGEGQTYRESKRFQAGDRVEIVSINQVHIGMTVCYDLRFPEVYRNLAKAGAQIITIPSAFTKITGQAHWHVLLRARAIESSCFILAPAQTGLHADGRETYGHSLIIDPWGTVLAEKEVDEPGFISAELDLDKVYEARAKVPSLTHDKEYTLNQSTVTI